MKNLAYWEGEGALEERKARIWKMKESPFAYEQEIEIARLLTRAKDAGLDIELGLKWARKIMMLERKETNNTSDKTILRLVHVCEGLTYADYRDTLQRYERKMKENIVQE